MDIVNVDPLKWVRSRPEQFFSAGVVEPIYILPYLMADVIELGGGACTILRDGKWWLVGSDVNWLQHDHYSVPELFNHVVPAPAHGEHSMRGEVLVGAFAKNVCVSIARRSLQIEGEAPPQNILDRALKFHCALMFSL
jgi:hypothetical protein